DGNFVVVWESANFFGDSQDGSGTAVVGQRLRTTAFELPRGITAARLVLRDDPLDARRKRLALRSDDPPIVLPGATRDDPTLGGGTLRVQSATLDHTYVLPAANWERLDKAGTVERWSYRDRALLSGPIAEIVVRPGRIRLRGEGAQLAQALDTNP